MKLLALSLSSAVECFQDGAVSDRAIEILKHNFSLVENEGELVGDARLLEQEEEVELVIGARHSE